MIFFLSQMWLVKIIGVVEEGQLYASSSHEKFILIWDLIIMYIWNQNSTM